MGSGKAGKLNIVILLAALLALTVLLAGCAKTGDDAQNTGSPTQGATPVHTPGSHQGSTQENPSTGDAEVTGHETGPESGTGKNGETEATPGISPTPGPDGTEAGTGSENGAEAGGQETGEAVGTDTGDNARDDDDDDDPEPVRDVTADTPFTAEQLKDAWELTFLKWIPEFPYGIFTGTTSSGTYDYAVFQDVSTDEILEYVDVLKTAGFTMDTDFTSGKNRVRYSACNPQDWYVKIKFRNGSVEIGSGYDTDTETSDGKTEELWLLGMPDELPKFYGGRFASSQINDGEVTVCYDEVSYESAAAYRDSLFAAGYMLNTDAGEQPDFMWYLAENENGYKIELVYADSIIRLRCEPVK